MRKCHCQQVVIADREDVIQLDCSDEVKASECPECVINECVKNPNGCLSTIRFSGEDRPRLGITRGQWVRYDDETSNEVLAEFCQREKGRSLWDDPEGKSDALRSNTETRCSHSWFEVFPGDYMVELDGQVSGYSAEDFDAAFPLPFEWEVEASPVTASGLPWAARGLREAFENAVQYRRNGQSHRAWLCEVCMNDGCPDSPCSHFDPVVEVAVRRRPVWHHGGMIVKPEAWETKAVPIPEAVEA